MSLNAKLRKKQASMPARNKKMQSENHPAFLNYQSGRNQLASTASLIICSLAVM